MSCIRRSELGRFMLASLLFLLAIATIDVSCGSLLGWIKQLHRRDVLRKDYDLINRNLLDKFYYDSDPDTNLAEALDWLKVATGELPRGRGPRQLPHTDSIVLFTSLLKVMDPGNPVCDTYGLEILKRNEAALGTKVSKPVGKLGDMRRIDEIVQQVGLTHARICRYNYPAELLRLMKKSDKEMLSKVTKMLDAIIETSERRVFTFAKTRKVDARQILREKALGVSALGFRETTALHQYLLTTTLNDPRHRYLFVVNDPYRKNKRIVDDTMVTAILDRHVFDHCDYLDQNFAQVLEPAAYDQTFFEKEYQYRAIDFANGEIMIWLQYFRLCREILADKRGLTHTLISVIKQAQI